MKSPEQPDDKNLARLGKLVRLAEETGLYLDVTGLDWNLVAPFLRAPGRNAGWPSRKASVSRCDRTALSASKLNALLCCNLEGMMQFRSILKADLNAGTVKSFDEESACR